MNGHTCSWNIWADTDAFTLQYEDCWLNFHGSWRRVAANVYTKISGIETAKCYRESDGVNCYVGYEHRVDGTGRVTAAHGRRDGPSDRLTAGWRRVKATHGP
ncbi:hypothetical protein ACLQ2R_14535 [Streptosporangium sp. DT93]|uniref:hypothetical protein n=1 Tax=Streptosporangium sp. DT93 TaxID=3393428 RepID=UPI003CE9CF60